MRGFSTLEEVTSWMESQEGLWVMVFPVPTNLLRHFEAQAPAPTVVAEVIRRYEAACPHVSCTRVGNKSGPLLS